MGDVVDAVQRDLEALPADLRGSATAALALALADSMDGRTAAMALAPIAKEIRDCLAALTAAAPAEVEGDAVDDLNARRAARRRSAAAG